MKIIISSVDETGISTINIKLSTEHYNDIEFGIYKKDNIWNIITEVGNQHSFRMELDDLELRALTNLFKEKSMDETTKRL